MRDFLKKWFPFVNISFTKNKSRTIVNISANNINKSIPLFVRWIIYTPEMYYLENKDTSERFLKYLIEEI